eukprot:11192912-Lingulodinium_polyedra.AAC.2
MSTTSKRRAGGASPLTRNALVENLLAANTTSSYLATLTFSTSPIWQQLCCKMMMRLLLLPLRAAAFGWSTGRTPRNATQLPTSSFNPLGLVLLLLLIHELPATKV